MKNFSNYTDYDKKENLHFESKAVHGALGTEPLTEQSACRFSGSDLQTSGTLEVQALRTAVWRTYQVGAERTMAILEGGIKHLHFPADRL